MPQVLIESLRYVQENSISLSFFILDVFFPSRRKAMGGRGINTVKEELHVDIHASGLLTF